MRVVVINILALLVLPGSTAHAHGFLLMIIPVMLGPLVIHLGVPAYLLFSSSFGDRRARIVGSYAVIMGIYYVAMWACESFEMYLVPVVPMILAVTFHVAAAKFPDSGRK